MSFQRAPGRAASNVMALFGEPGTEAGITMVAFTPAVPPVVTAPPVPSALTVSKVCATNVPVPWLLLSSVPRAALNVPSALISAITRPAAGARLRRPAVDVQAGRGMVGSRVLLRVVVLGAGDEQVVERVEPDHVLLAEREGAVGRLPEPLRRGAARIDQAEQAAVVALDDVAERVEHHLPRVRVRHGARHVDRLDREDLG